MKCVPSLIAVLALSACLASSAAMADAWSDYTKLTERFYQIDNQSAARITCRVASPVLDAMLEMYAKKSVPVSGDLREFSVAVDKGKGLSFKTPTITGNSGSAQDDEMVKKSSTEIIGGLQNLISSAFEGMLTPTREKMRNLSVVTKGGATTVSYSNDVEKVETTYTGSDDETTETTPTSVLKSKSHYIPLNGKLALEKSSVERSGQDGMEGSMSVSYQKLGASWFPAEIITDFKSAPVQAQHIEIEFRDCKTQD
jgi:hypothetical protein